ncbi:pseudouridine synthase [Lentibacillus sediminis]|uniref:pseudouridine synthase n=1 Tax=Lentibacillus sediminis TaxID=1940529 RepID=UPI000C1C70C8|nr:pseudouridine synthase [Lentibacillus sediminis]
MRLDKLLANTGHGSRKEVKALLKKKQVSVNLEVVKDGSVHVDTKRDEVTVDGQPVHYQQFIYLMMNKPPDVISATEDSRERTVVDLLQEAQKRFQPFPVGRLDKDTEGLLLLTNDGKLAHQLTSPKKEVGKTYYAEVEGTLTEEDRAAFKAGVKLDDGYQTMPAELTIIEGGAMSRVEITIYEGKFHQVKRMMEAVGKKVRFLKRLSMGSLYLDNTLKPGEYRELTEDELTYCLSLKK